MRTDEIPMYRLYGDLSWLWPIMSPPEEYAEESVHWRGLLRAYRGGERLRILELGVGGGHHLSHFTSHHDAVAVDIAEPMLRLSQRLNPLVAHHLGDMRSIRLGERFDAVMIHDAISHLLSEDDIGRTFRTAAEHLMPGGVVLAAPDYFEDEFTPPAVQVETHEIDGIRLDYTEHVRRPDPRRPMLETVFVYMIQQDGTLRIEHDRMHTGLFPLATWTNRLEEAGFRPEIHRFTLNHWPRDYIILAGVKKG